MLPILYGLNSSGKVTFYECVINGDSFYTRNGLLKNRDTNENWSRRSFSDVHHPTFRSAALRAEEAAIKWYEENRVKKRLVHQIDDLYNRPKYEAPVTVSHLLNLKDAYGRKDFDPNRLYLCQVKYDGERATASYADGVVTLHSRQKKIITGNDHIKNDLKILYERYPPIQGMIFDGELVNDSMDRISLRSENSRHVKTEMQRSLKYMIFDIICDDILRSRLELLDLIMMELPSLMIAKNYGCITIGEAEKMCSIAVDEGYEGVVLKDLDGLYPVTSTRTCNMIKVKPLDDEEFIIVGAEQGTNAHDGLIIFIVQDQNDMNVVFKVTPSLTHEERSNLWNQYLADPSSLLGRQVTVAFKCRNKYNVPEEARMIRFR